METKVKLQKKLAILESANDHLISELSHIDELMYMIGFNNGIAGLKETAKEFYQEFEKQSQDE